MNASEHKIPDPVDIHVGSRVRLRRTLLGLSQEKLGKAVGLTFQQIQKYERGANRIGSSRLFQFSNVLDVPISFFFDDYDPENKPSHGNKLISTKDMHFIHDFSNLNDEQKKAVHQLVKTMVPSE